MTSRERVRMALNHQEPDRMPIDFGAMRSTGMMVIAYNNLKKYLGMDTKRVPFSLFSKMAMLVILKKSPNTRLAKPLTFPS